MEGKCADLHCFRAFAERCESPVVSATAAPKPFLESAGRSLGGLTVVQASLRRLAPGEVRANLLRKCAKSFRTREHMSCSDKLACVLPA